MGSKPLGGLAALALGAASAILVGCGGAASPAGEWSAPAQRPAVAGDRADSSFAAFAPARRPSQLSPLPQIGERAAPELAAPSAEPSPPGLPPIRVSTPELMSGVIACGPRTALCPPG